MVAFKLDVGDRAPNFVLPDATGTGHGFYSDVNGCTILLILFGHGALHQQLDELSRLHLSLSKNRDIQTFGIYLSDIESLAAMVPNNSGTGPIILADVKGKITEAYSSQLARSGPVALVLDPNQRIVAIHDGPELFKQVGDTVKGMAQARPPRMIESVAPVLMIPNVIEPTFCQRLIQAWNAGEKSSGLVHEILGDKKANVVVTSSKRRIDHYIAEPTLRSDVASILGRRLGAEVRKSFFFHKFRFEAFRIGCYHAADRGFFKVHRDFIDNVHESRRFAVSVNLNAEGYVGGDLRFPEYGPDLYRPATGGAIVFSGSLMHEVVPVTAGERYVLLTFLLAVNE